MLVFGRCRWPGLSALHGSLLPSLTQFAYPKCELANSAAMFPNFIKLLENRVHFCKFEVN